MMGMTASSSMLQLTIREITTLYTKVIDVGGTQQVHQNAVANAFLQFYCSLMSIAVEVSLLDVEWVHVLVLTLAHQA